MKGTIKVAMVIFVSSLCMVGCKFKKNEAQSSTGVNRAKATIKTQANGLTLEQNNIKDRLELENAPGAVQHLYILSAYSGQCILYSTVKGKVTSSGKRLTPYTVAAIDGEYVNSSMMGFSVNIGGTLVHTPEVLQDDGTYGNSIDYLYWWDVQGRYHQHYIQGGQIVHLSDQPIPVKSVIINVERSEYK